MIDLCKRWGIAPSTQNKPQLTILVSHSLRLSANFRGRSFHFHTNLFFVVKRFSSAYHESKILVIENKNIVLKCIFWRNLQAALGSFYDYILNQETNGGGGESLPFSIESLVTDPPKMVFVSDVTIGEGQSVPKDTRFIKTWRIKNPSAKAWP